MSVKPSDELRKNSGIEIQLYRSKDQAYKHSGKVLQMCNLIKNTVPQHALLPLCQKHYLANMQHLITHTYDVGVYYIEHTATTCSKLIRNHFCAVIAIHRKLQDKCEKNDISQKIALYRWTCTHHQSCMTLRKLRISTMQFQKKCVRNLIPWVSIVEMS